MYTKILTLLDHNVINHYYHNCKSLEQIQRVAITDSVSDFYSDNDRKLSSDGIHKSELQELIIYIDGDEYDLYHNCKLSL